jgi:hypothetical protein
MNEYHPEFHPVTTTTFVQNVSSPTTTINQNVSQSEASDPKPVLPPERREEIQPKKAPIAILLDAPSRPNVRVDPPQAPGTYLGPNVQIGPGVTFGGNVYVQGNLIIGGTREHPVLTTTQ